MHAIPETSPAIVAIGTAVPPCRVDQHLADELVDIHYADVLSAGSRRLLSRFLHHHSIRQRYFSFDTINDLPTLKSESVDSKTARFIKWGTALGYDAAQIALKKASLMNTNVSALIVNTCTGYACPGLSGYIAEKLCLSQSVKTFDLGGMGCGGALPNLELAAALAGKGETVLCLSVEICSATFEMEDDISLILSNALFGDGASAALVMNSSCGIRLLDSDTRILPHIRDSVRFVTKNGRLYNTISGSLPDMIAEIVPEMTMQFCSRTGVSLSDVSHWAIHPGGHKILNALQSKLALTDKQIAPSRYVLQNYGNMSSPTSMFILDEINAASPSKGDLGIIVAFGAGFSAYISLVSW